jgi:hypothetical protein
MPAWHELAVRQTQRHGVTINNLDVGSECRHVEAKVFLDRFAMTNRIIGGGAFGDDP